MARWRILFRFLIFLLLFSLISGIFCIFFSSGRNERDTIQGEIENAPFVIVLDAGHGGEDGGAVSASGIFEKDLNLSIAFLVRDLLVANGVEVVMTREEDILLYDRNVHYEGRKKALDLAARRQIAENTERAMFVSIHMNAYPLPQYSGLQVWYSPHHEHSRVLADCIQKNVCTSLQSSNNRKIKSAGDNIYLLSNLRCPAVLIECGFLSNPEEAERLNTEEYQEKLAFLIFLSIMEARD